VPLTPEKLNERVRQASGYDWKMEGKAVHFYNKKLRQARESELDKMGESRSKSKIAS
jgi:hypothetical protein